jgi:mannosyltransferase OCH1-like enzyme
VILSWGGQDLFGPGFLSGLEGKLWGKTLPSVEAPVLEFENKIPRIIHQTFRYKELKPEFLANIAEMKELNPGWDYRYYDDDAVRDYISLNYGSKFLEYLDALNLKYGAARADLFRYLLMYKEGGVYLDIKSRMSRPLNDVLQSSDRFLISQWKNNWGIGYKELRHIPGGEYQQWFIIAAPGHPYLKSVIDAVVRNIASYNPLRHSVGRSAVFRITGPIAYTLAIVDIKDQHSHRMVDSELDLGLYYTFYPKYEHQAALEGHYSQVYETLVPRNAGSSAAAAMCRMVKRLRGRL